MVRGSSFCLPSRARASDFFARGTEIRPFEPSEASILAVYRAARMRSTWSRGRAWPSKSQAVAAGSGEAEKK